MLLLLQLLLAGVIKLAVAAPPCSFPFASIDAAGPAIRSRIRIRTVVTGCPIHLLLVVMLSHRLLAGRQRRRVVVVKVLEPKPKPLLDLGQQRLGVHARGGRRGGDLGDLGGLLAEAGEQVGELGLRLRQLRPEEGCLSFFLSFSFEVPLLAQRKHLLLLRRRRGGGREGERRGRGRGRGGVGRDGEEEVGGGAGAVWLQRRSMSSSSSSSRRRRFLLGDLGLLAELALDLRGALELLAHRSQLRPGAVERGLEGLDHRERRRGSGRRLCRGGFRCRRFCCCCFCLREPLLLLLLLRLFQGPSEPPGVVSRSRELPLELLEPGPRLGRGGGLGLSEEPQLLSLLVPEPLAVIAGEVGRGAGRAERVLGVGDARLELLDAEAQGLDRLGVGGALVAEGLLFFFVAAVVDRSGSSGRGGSSFPRRLDVGAQRLHLRLQARDACRGLL